MVRAAARRTVEATEQRVHLGVVPVAYLDGAAVGVERVDVVVVD